MKLEKDILVVKVGTNVLADTTGETEKLNEEAFTNIGQEVRELSDSGLGVILVSSGAITAGVLGEQKRRENVAEIAELQRYAARGWDTVVQQWKSAIGADRVSSALLTKHEMHHDTTRAKALGVIACCLAHNDILVVNENDVINDDEVKFGDNDTLAAALAAECALSGLGRSVRLVLLTNVNGLYRDIGDRNSLITEVTNIAEIEDCAGEAVDEHSRGGMRTKVQAAQIATQAGVEVFIAGGHASRAIEATLSGNGGTYFSCLRV